MSAPPEQAHDEQQYYGPQEGHEQRAQAEIVLIDGAGAEHWGQKKPTEERTYDSHYDIEKFTLPVVRAHDHACQPAQ